MSGTLTEIRKMGRRPAADGSRSFGSGRRAKDWRPEILPGDRGMYMGRSTDWSCPVARARRVRRSLKRSATREARRAVAAELQLQLATQDDAMTEHSSEQPAHFAACSTDTAWCPTVEAALPQWHGTGIPLDWVKRRRQPVPEQAAT